jgi:hypothetical protein
VNTNDLAYYHTDWAGFARTPVTINGLRGMAFENPDEWWKKGNKQQIGLLNSIQHEFKLCFGQGRGTVIRRYVYFEMSGKQHYIHVGAEWPDAIDVTIHKDHN